MSFLLLAGCGNTNSSSNTKNSSQTKVSKVKTAPAYQDLSKKTQKQVKFDVTKDDDNADLSITINNKSKQDVKFNQAKFSLLDNGDKKKSSNKKGMLTVKAGEQATISAIFKDISTDVLGSSDLSIQYLNSKNIIARPDFSDDVAQSSQDDQAPSNQTSASNTQNQSQSQDQTQDQTQSDTTQASADDNAVVKRADQAEDLYRRTNGDWTGGVSVEKADGGWQVYEDGNAVAFVDNAGNVSSKNGTTTYDETLNAQQNGGPVQP